MTNKEAIKYLIRPFATSTRSYNEYLKQREAYDLAIKALEGKPQGEWIYDEKLFNWKCSQCFESPKTLGYVGNRDFMNEHFKFCNHCGARMKGGEEE